jgi:hypothetical protein
MTNKTPTFSDAFEQLDEVSSIQEIHLTNEEKNAVHTIKNQPGKHASVKIYNALAQLNNGLLSTTEAIHGLELYGDYVAEEELTPNTHPNIRLLINIIKKQQAWQIVVVTN